MGFKRRVMAFACPLLQTRRRRIRRADAIGENTLQRLGKREKRPLSVSALLAGNVAGTEERGATSDDF